MIIVPDNQAFLILKPGKQSLNLSPALITYHFNITSVKELLVKFTLVVGLITNQLIRGILSKTAVHRIFKKRFLMGRSCCL